MSLENPRGSSERIQKLEDDTSKRAAMLSLALEILPEELLMHGLGGPEYKEIEAALEETIVSSAPADVRELPKLIGETIEAKLARHADATAIAQGVVEKMRKEMGVYLN